QSPATLSGTVVACADRGCAATPRPGSGPRADHNIQIPTTNISQNISQRVNTTPVTPVYSAVAPPPAYPPANHNSPVNFPPPVPEPLPVPAPVEPIREDSQYDLTQLWQQVRGHIQQLPTQALLGQMCHLIDFNGSIARVGVKAVWYDKVKSYVPVITTAFRQAFQQEIQVTLEKATGASVISTRRNPQGQNSPPVQQQPTPQPPTVAAQPVSTVSTPPPAPVKSQPVVTNTAPIQAISSPAKVQPPSSNWDHDGVLKAAESLAKFFSGEIIRVTDDSFHLANSVTSTQTHEIYESYVDDEYA
ncbi:MAG: hypothetical protein ACKPB9_19695, partial [Dolichospermum sp.]